MAKDLDDSIRSDDKVNRVAGLCGSAGISIWPESILRHSLIVGRRLTMVWTHSKATCNKDRSSSKLHPRYRTNAFIKHYQTFWVYSNFHMDVFEIRHKSFVDLYGGALARNKRDQYSFCSI
jgi:hypothetical protein